MQEPGGETGVLVGLDLPSAVKTKAGRNATWREQDGGGVGGHGVHCSPWIYQEYTFRHRSAFRTPAESGQEYLTTEKEYIEPHKTRQDEGTG